MGEAMRIIRWLGILLLVVVVAGVGIATYISLTFDPNDHRDRVIDVVKERTGRDLVIGQPISLTYFPWFGIRLRDVSLQNAEGFGDEPFARFAELSLRINLVPLMDGHLVVDTIALNEAKFNLRRLEDGKDNWSELLAKEEAAPDSEPPADAAGTPTAMDKWIKDYTVRGIKLVDGMVRLIDEQAGAAYELTDIDLETGAITPQAPVPMEGALKFGTGDQGVSGRLSLAGDLGLDQSMKKISVPNLQLELVTSGAGIPGGELTTSLSAAVEMNQESGDLNLADLLVKGPGGLQLSGNMDANLGEELSYTGALSLAKMSLRQLLKSMGIDVPTRDASVLEGLSGEFKIDGTAEKLDLNNLRLTLDDTTLDGKLSADLREAPKFDFSLAGDTLDVDRYLPPEDSSETKPDSAGANGKAPPAAEAMTIPVLPGANGVITLGHLKVAGMTLTNIKVRLRSDAGGIQLDPISAKLYQGTYNGSLKVRNKGKAPQWSAAEKVQNVQVGPLLRDLTGEDRLEGTGQITINLTGAGFSDAALKRNTKGKASLEFTDGALKGINLAQVVRDIKARLKGQKVESKGPEQTDFSVLSASLDIGNGKVTNNDLSMKTPYLRVGGQGQANLVNEALDYKMTAKVVGTAKGQGGQEFSDLEGIPIAVNVRGTLSEPVYQPDYEATIRAVAGKRIDQEKGKLEDRARDELGKALERLF